MQIRELISGPLQEVARLDEQIAALHATIDRLSQERNRLDEYIQAHRALISGARQMPRDVVEAIFIYCLPTDRNAVMSASEAPILLGEDLQSLAANLTVDTRTLVISPLPHSRR